MNNTKEMGVEDWEKEFNKMRKGTGQFIVPTDVVKNFIHQELQKAKVVMLHKLYLCAIGKYEGDALENVKAQIKEYQSELDQPNK